MSKDFYVPVWKLPNVICEICQLKIAKVTMFIDADSHICNCVGSYDVTKLVNDSYLLTEFAREHLIKSHRYIGYVTILVEF